MGDNSILNGVVKIWGSRAITNIEETVLHLKKDEPDIQFAVQLGDAIQDDKDGDSGIDRKNLKEVAGALSAFPWPVYHLLGNHDDVNLGAKEAASALGMPKSYYSFDAGSLTGIALSCRSQNHKYPTVPDEQVKFLARTLERARKPVVVFVHQALADQSLEKVFWFKDKPESAFVANRAEVIEILEKSGKVLAVFNGHLHSNNFTKVGKIPFFTIQSISQVVDESGEPSKAFAVVEVAENKHVRVEIFGREHLVYEA
jgi:hypothetical protein